MALVNFQFRRTLMAGIAVGISAIFTATTAPAESAHGIAMYGTPALPHDFVSLPYANPNAPKGGRIVFGNTGGFNSLNPFVQTGTVPWQWRHWGYESLMGRSGDEPFTLYGLLAESVDVPEDRSWVEFTLREEARFADGSPVTVADVIWSFETLGTIGNLRYRGLWGKIAEIKPTGPRSLRITFNEADRELALIAGLRPILKKAQWQDKDFTAGTLQDIPIGTGAYMVEDFEVGRFVALRRNPDYWARDLPLRRGTRNFDDIRIEFFGDNTVLFEAFKAGELTAIRESNADKWANQYDFPAVQNGDIVKSEIPHQRPSGMTGLVMNTRRAPFDDWRVREAMLKAFNFEFINETITGGAQPRITSYYAGSGLAMSEGPATGKVRALLTPFAQDLLPGALDGYGLPQGNGTARNRAGLRGAVAMLKDAGWHVNDGQLRNDTGQAFSFRVLLRKGNTGMQTVMDIYIRALKRLGMTVNVETVDNAQYTARVNAFDFDMTNFRRDLSLSPGNEQRLYWGSDAADAPGGRNLMGLKSPAVDGMIDTMLTSQHSDDFTAAVKALDRILTTGRYVIPIWKFDVGRIAHDRHLQYPDYLPIYGDRSGFLPEVWWYQAD